MFEKGKPRAPGAGRKPGVPNITSGKVKELIFQALQQQEGGALEYLKARALDEPRAFLALLGQLLPTQITGDDEGGPVRIETITRRVIKPPAAD